jgi:hypothetical protein
MLLFFSVNKKDDIRFGTGKSKEEKGKKIKKCWDFKSYLKYVKKFEDILEE